MRRLPLLTALLLAVSGFAHAAKSDPAPDEVEKIISSFADNEAAFAKARENYTYRQTAKMQEFDENGAPGGRFEITSDIIFTNEGKRTERSLMERQQGIANRRARLKPSILARTSGCHELRPACSADSGLFLAK